MDGELRRFMRNEDGQIFWQYSDGSHRGLNSLDVMLINKALEASLPSAQPSDVVEEELANIINRFRNHHMANYNTPRNLAKYIIEQCPAALTTQQATKDEDAAFQWAWVQKYKGKVRVNREGIKREWFGIGYRSTTQQAQSGDE